MITVIQPDTGVPLERFATWIARAGQDYHVIPLQHRPVPTLDECGEAIIVLGGRGNAIDAEASPFLPALYDLLREAVASDVPVLGICLGHQILGHAFGGTVTTGHPTQGEEGAYEVALNESGSSDPLFQGLDAQFTVAESHHDVVEILPPNATLLASSPTCPNQAFRIGSAVGVQFHPEVSPTVMARWTAGDGGDGPRMLSEMEAVDQEVARSGKAIAYNFVRLLRA
ncbi:type 1 glutamine amidotransferase [Corynebacterium sp. 153RC1]|uniref:type 1 glutamine amidotransferase n=1 Tax=unclassified Corynebacterium TaxID=2624378 RepID=UPI00211C5990|nr:MULTISPECIES: type 1 glutamine amidotransferase [unclassified Corynebacterium]MCQ9370866.1 type 1 glutamine amidotransferase [Corynebacterium sp. 35RC1]MCQ9353195.1 type 1 glutamine amidotransferase [Corynebacterium sp. 209RC1]MCQ9355510.1 type 1 glutamine amidotransferase [Corynebacterium sp. 1222RC1]MCQ9357693.1 type 1 glutamine amidotransferase [Corynebacterium sp. 122RC1]MCQ9359900.1 type 1 glutamine amidotransferase [Corynebacterium sp. 142RC1]